MKINWSIVGKHNAKIANLQSEVLAALGEILEFLNADFEKGWSFMIAYRILVDEIIMM